MKKKNHKWYSDPCLYMFEHVLNLFERRCNHVKFYIIFGRNYEIIVKKKFNLTDFSILLFEFNSI